MTVEQADRPEERTAGARRRTVVLIDGENIDATLGSSVLGRRPLPEERPRWERLTAHLEQQWGQPVLGLFFLNASHGQLPMGFVQALLAMNYRPIPLSGRAEEKVVDLGILRTLEALRDSDDDIVLGSHDGDFADALAALADEDEHGVERRIGVAGFREFVSSHLIECEPVVFDLEYDVAAFNLPLPRVRVIPLEEFDPWSFLR